MGVYWKYSSNNLFYKKKEFSKGVIDKNGSEDNLIHCFKDGQPCSAGTSLLKDQINDDVVNANPFEVTDSNVDEANSPTNLIDASDDKDDFVDID